VLAAGVFLRVRVAPDVHGKPLFEYEAIVGQISVHGIVSVLRTVIWDRGAFLWRGPLALGAVVALVAWRGRPPRAALPALAIMASAAVFLIGDVRLSQRFDVGSHGSRAVATPSQALDQLTAAVRGFSGGTALLALVFAALAAVGLVWCVRNGRAFGAVAVLWLVVPPLLTLVARSPSVPSVKSEPRHLVSDLAAWAVLVALGSRAISSRLPEPGRLAVYAAVGVLALESTSLSAIDGALTPSAAARHDLGLYLSVNEKALRATVIRCGGR
jgi:hypothetical protein